MAEKKLTAETEKKIEALLVKKARENGGEAYKFTSPGNNGVPDRIVIFPPGLVYFVELKAPGEKLRVSQEGQMKRLKRIGCDARVIDSAAGVKAFIAEAVKVSEGAQAVADVKRIMGE